MAKVKDTASFIAAAREIHGDKYDYSQSVYVGSNKKITIVCRNCGPFQVAQAGSHYGKTTGRGCRACEQRETLERKGQVHACIDCGAWAKYAGTSKRCPDCRKKHSEKRRQQAKARAEDQARRSAAWEALIAAKAKRACVDCGGEVTKKSVRCFSCIIKKRRESGEAAKERKRIEKEEAREARERSAAEAKRRSLPVIKGTFCSCSECGKKVFKRRVAKKVYCSANCQWRAARRTRRARVREVYIEAVDLGEVANRDKWICQLCKKKVEKNAEYKRQATLDHIIPISMGGLHEITNCQLAHFDCNSSKGNRVETLF